MLAQVEDELEGAEAEHHEDDAEDVDAARLEAERLQQTFDALLRIARLDTGRHRIIREPIALDKLVGDAVELYAPEAEARRQSIGAAVVPCTVTGDRNLIFQAVSNLIDNALKFAPAESEVRVDLEAEGGTARLTVRDSGPGVDEEFRSRLTERFFRAPGSEGVAGTGLGLTLSRELVEQFGGALSASNRSEGGARLRIEFPIHRAGLSEKPSREAEGRERGAA